MLKIYKSLEYLLEQVDHSMPVLEPEDNSRLILQPVDNSRLVFEL